MRWKIRLTIMAIVIGLISFGCKKEEVEVIEVEETIIEEIV